ncbi:hypothetical protein CLU83_1528 [Flavobacterium sp. 1]|uniref:hypothetical protein n=1 Tax=Flavobacterium sp. 1 TaxID=2035200 RepID=UPI000C247917|nr:hypothetical protein [Flavobacterium sp. 1]PJJ08273.1 hypothetical protein CLU83_1528 [Flavobacterium sp. 1]
MKKMNETDALNELILINEQLYHTDFRLLKDQFHIAYESVKPINLIKNVVHEITASPEIKEDVIGNVMGLATGFISKKLIVDENSGTLKKVIGTILQFAITNIVSKHSINIKAVGTAVFNNFFKRNNH